MRHFILTITAITLILSACGNSKQNSKSNTEALNSSTLASDSKESEKLTKTQFIEKIWDYNISPNDWKYKGNKPAIIDFYADWCGPCRIASPILDEIGSEFDGKLLVYKINTDQERELAQVFGISGIPAFLYIPATGKPVMMSGIGRSKEETKKMFIDNIEKYLLVKN
jgi:thioredoxin